ncbi:AraC family transcriptional regulator [Dermatobacter hominis]|uniref:AraC family transcriptional regulator n=1 Tax=Dermatobacter hominis TaxID=2884263 RepID=UPI001D113F6A|nr:AraC family transcriptional regulator [Dermatobacter hominis]UDY36319.1 AraC family transcriptional regulator [Dermatobacter hominis]
MDVLTDLLDRSRARGAAFAHTSATAPWGVRFDDGAGLAVHVVVDGQVHLTVDDPDGTTELVVRAGELALVRGDLPHRMAHEPGAPCIPLAEMMAGGARTDAARGYVLGPAGVPPRPDAVFFCGAYLFDGDLCDGLLASLPPVLHVRPSAGSPLRATLDVFAAELLRDRAGQQVLLDRLLDVVLVQMLREELDAQGDDAPPWFRAQSDPAVGEALRAIHADPARAWTVAELAELVGLSRAAFARRFTAAMGEAPLGYLTAWRMALGRDLLRTTDDGLAAVAAAVGYSSEFAFAAAFKRHHGSPPGRWRARLSPERRAG